MNNNLNKSLELISYPLCPYVQRAVIMLTEKSVQFKRTDIDLSNKPDWFVAQSPTGKVPMLIVDQRSVLFESHIICEYIDNTTAISMMPSAPLRRAQHQGWIVLGSNILNSISRLYSTHNQLEFDQAQSDIKVAFSHIENELVLPYFDGKRFMMVDAVFAPIFRYFDVFENYVSFNVFDELERVQQWRRQLAFRTSVMGAVAHDYSTMLIGFVRQKNSYLSKLLV